MNRKIAIGLMFFLLICFSFNVIAFAEDKPIQSVQTTNQDTINNSQINNSQINNSQINNQNINEDNKINEDKTKLDTNQDNTNQNNINDDKNIKKDNNTKQNAVDKENVKQKPPVVKQPVKQVDKRVQKIPGQYIVIILNEHKLYLYKGDKLIKKYIVAVGKPSTPTVIGRFSVLSKFVPWKPVFGARFIQFYGNYGIHGTNVPSSVGKSVSHGCIRMARNDVIELYNLVKIGTPVIVKKVI